VNTIFKRLALGVCLSFACSATMAQQDANYTPDHLYPVDALHQDLKFLKSVLEEAHPSLYRYTPKDTIDIKFAVADKQLTHPMTEMEFWKIAAPCVAAIRSGHTGIFPSSDYAAWSNKNLLPRMPLSVFVDGENLYVSRFQKQGTGLFRGAKILSIDDHPAGLILATLKTLISPEGYNDHIENSSLETPYFDESYCQYFGFKPQYKVTYLDSAGATKVAVLKAFKAGYGISVEKNRALVEKESDELKESVNVSYPADMPATAVLKIKRFTYNNYYEGFDDQFFKQLKDDKIKNLVIDIRGNGGGYLSIGMDLMRYLIKGSFSISRGVEAKAIKFSFDSCIIKNGSYDVKQYRIVKPIGGRYTVKGMDGFVYSYPEFNFNNNVYLLTDAGTFSAATLFAADLKSQRKITIVGEETGGGEIGTDGDGFSVVRLPQTKLLLYLPQFWVTSVVSHKNTGHGVMPDVKVVPAIADRVNGTDVVMQKVKELINKK
jgi:hypothetical protein